MVKLKKTNLIDPQPPLVETLPDKVALEYEMSQQSAEHYDTMIWTLISVLLAFSLIILYLVFGSTEIHPITLDLTLLFIGAFSLFYFNLLIEAANEKKDHKYSICKEIEAEWKFKGQNLGIESLPLSGGKNKGRGMKILRTIKVVGLILYLCAIIVVITGKHLPNTMDVWLWVPTIFAIIAIAGSILLEFYYKLCHPN